MKKPVRKLALFVVVLFALIVANLNWLQVVRANSLRSNPANTRVLLDEYQRQRGTYVVMAKPSRCLKRPTTSSNISALIRKAPSTPQSPVPTRSSSAHRAWREPKTTYCLAPTTGSLVRRSATSSPAAIPRGRQRRTHHQLRGAGCGVQSSHRRWSCRRGGREDPKTGAVLALVSTPSYDPNTLSSHSPSAIRDASQALSAKSPDPRNNQALSENYPPGSTFKIIDVACRPPQRRQTRR